MEIKRYTEDSITLEFGEEISPELNKQIVNTRKYIDSLELENVIETVISYTRLVIYYDPLRMNATKLIQIIEPLPLQSVG